ncbi:hypothetical protein VNO78_26540 [Psophocarpus tetragonolobus]|uniref:Uncharacterized protein n=1 Tax=Psophocarpus tetragonolobus TaxID=3891 RepID=A0AAN9X9V3_PSOTE
MCSRLRFWLKSDRHCLFNYGHSVVGSARGGFGSISGWRLLEMKERRELVAKCEPSGGVARKSDEEFVKVLRQVHPYISVHTNRVFVLVLSAEIVDSPYLDAFLKVNPSFSYPVPLVQLLQLSSVS